MSFVTLVWGILPLGIALAAVTASWWSTATHPRSFLQWVLMVPVTALGAVAVIMLAAMLRGAWPTYLAHVLTAAAALLALVQLGLRCLGRGRRP